MKSLDIARAYSLSEKESLLRQSVELNEPPLTAQEQFVATVVFLSAVTIIGFALYGFAKAVGF